MEAQTVEGTVAFYHLIERDSYKGREKATYDLTVNIDEETAQKMKDMGVHVKYYEGNPQRKFTTKFKVPVLDGTQDPNSKKQWEGEVPWGSKVKVLWETTGIPNEEYGIPTYVKAVRVLAEPVRDGNDPLDYVPDDF